MTEADKQSAPVRMWMYVMAFAIAYVPLMLVAAIVLNLLDVNAPQGANYACLAFASGLVAYTFAEKHRRGFENGEYWRLVGGSVAVDFAWSVGPYLALSFSAPVTFSAIAAGSALTVGIHALFLAFMYSSLMVSNYVPKAKG